MVLLVAQHTVDVLKGNDLQAGEILQCELCRWSLPSSSVLQNR